MGQIDIAFELNPWVTTPLLILFNLIIYVTFVVPIAFPRH